jgi:hypothetical protein
VEAERVNRRGFLSLVATGVTALAAQPVLERLPLGVPDLPRVDLLAGDAEPPPVMRYVMAFAPELGFQEIAEPGGVIRLATLSQLVFRPERLIFDACDFSQWELMQMLYPHDDEPERFEPSGVPLALFQPLGYGQRLICGTVAPGDQIVLALRNVSNVEAEIRNAAMIGSGIR